VTQKIKIRRENFNKLFGLLVWSRGREKEFPRNPPLQLCSLQSPPLNKSVH